MTSHIWDAGISGETYNSKADKLIGLKEMMLTSCAAPRTMRTLRLYAIIWNQLYSDSSQGRELTFIRDIDIQLIIIIAELL